GLWLVGVRFLGGFDGGAAVGGNLLAGGRGRGAGGCARVRGVGARKNERAVFDGDLMFAVGVPIGRVAARTPVGSAVLDVNRVDVLAGVVVAVGANVDVGAGIGRAHVSTPVTCRARL